jgi:hypothetical protein
MANSILSQLGRDQAGWLDDGSEHQHRISLSVRVESLDYVTRYFVQALEREGVQVRARGTGRRAGCCTGAAAAARRARSRRWRAAGAAASCRASSGSSG